MSEVKFLSHNSQQASHRIHSDTFTVQVGQMVSNAPSFDSVEAVLKSRHAPQDSSDLVIKM